MDIKQSEFNDSQKRKMMTLYKEDSNGCWIWQKSTFVTGYGQISFNGKNMTAHRVSYAMFNGDITNGLHVRHKCDVRKCINPDHLELGTNKDNINDRKERHGTYFGGVGEESLKGTLTKQQVIEARELALEMDCADVARKLGLGYDATRNAIIGDTWGHLLDPAPVSREILTTTGARHGPSKKHRENAQRMIDENARICATCKEKKTLENFSKNKRDIIGRNKECKPCAVERVRKHREKKRGAF